MTEYTPTVTIAAPVRNRAWILNQYLHHIVNIDYPKKLINIHFVLNDSTDKSRDILINFQQKYRLEYNNIYIDTINRFVPEDKRISSIRNQHTYHHLSILRNYILSKVKTDYLFSVDSDILVSPKSLLKLLFHNKDIISGLIYNGYIKDPVHPYRYTNIMKYESDGVLRHVSNFYTKTAPLLKESKVLEIDVTGAMCLIKREVCRLAKYGWHYQGEDVYFCDTAKKNGFKIHCDISVFAQHIMNSNQL